MEVTAHTVRVGSTGVRDSVDVDVTVWLEEGRRSVEGEVTLARDHTGEFAAYGVSADMWVSGALLIALSEAVGEDDLVDLSVAVWAATKAEMNGEVQS
jgi:hypothetical protein